MTQATVSRQEALKQILALPPAERKAAIWAAVGFKALPKQKEILACKARTIQLVAGEQAGKSVCAAMWASEQMWTQPDPTKVQLGWIVGKHYEMTRFVYDYLAQYLKVSGLSTHISTSWNPGYMTAVGNQVIRTKSALDAESLMGEAPDWIIVDEAAQLPWESVLRVFARSGPKRARVMLCGTYEGSIGWYPETYDQWTVESIQQRDDVMAFRYPSWLNTYRYPGGEQDPEILRLKGMMPEDQFNERIGAIAAPPKGLVHSLFRLKIHAAKPLDFYPGEHIYLGIDPGKSHTGSAYAVVVAQRRKDDQLRIVDTVYEQGRTTEEIIDICKSRWWWRSGPMHGVIDRAAAQTKTVTPYTDADLWAKAGLPCRYEYVPISEGISRVNGFLKIDPVTGKPGLLIDPNHCIGLIAEWGGCSSPLGGGIKVYQWESNRDGEIIGGVPRDRYNDASKALAYLICLNFPKWNQSNDSSSVPIKRYGQADPKALARR